MGLWDPLSTALDLPWAVVGGLGPAEAHLSRWAHTWLHTEALWISRVDRGLVAVQDSGDVLSSQKEVTWVGERHHAPIKWETASKQLLLGAQNVPRCVLASSQNLLFLILMSFLFEEAAQFFVF